MIVSASYRTDIPAFYADWFAARLDAGWAAVASPYGGPPARVPLRGPTLDGFVFWTRNAAPFLGVLDRLRADGLPFVLQYTVTGYPRALEPHVPGRAAAVAAIHALAARFGPRVVVWRYDPVLLGAAQTPDWHRATFAGLADQLAGAVDEVALSFVTFYAKTRRNLARCGAGGWRAPDAAERRALSADFARLAAARGMGLSLCAQPDSVGPGCRAGRCVDARRLTDVAAGWGLTRPIRARPRPNRPGCGCDESRDVGAYDTCLHGCAYCYAVGSASAARAGRARHDPAGAFLLPPPGGTAVADAADPAAAQPRLL